MLQDVEQNLKLICKISKKTEIMGNRIFNVIENFDFFPKW